MKKIVLALVICLFATGAYAGTKPFQLSLTPDIAIQPRGTQINGVTLNIWGENPQHALALGLVNGSTGDSSGVSLGFLANYAQNYKGLEFAWLGNYASKNFSGMQLAAFNYAGTLRGLQLGFINFAQRSPQGVQIGLINIMAETKTWFRNFPNEVAPGMVLVNWRY
jgi:hypothetical protein